MPTNRTRRRRGGNSISSDVWALFAVGCGWNHRPEDEIRELWSRYGAQFMQHWTHDHDPWAVIELGYPTGY